MNQRQFDIDGDDKHAREVAPGYIDDEGNATYDEGGFRANPMERMFDKDRAQYEPSFLGKPEQEEEE